MKTVKISIATLLLATLTACGSGGGSGSNASNNTSNASPSTPSTTPSQPTTTLNGNRLNIKKGPPVEIFYGDVQTTTDKNILMVDGRAVELVPAGFSGNIVAVDIAAHRYIIRNDLSYVKHGYYEDDSHIYYFAQGDVTPEQNIQTSGQVRYSGNSVSKIDNNRNIAADGASAFTVDFAAKTLSGTVSGGQLENPVELRATISGNGFSGEHNGTNTYGRFYGPQAEELGGTFVNTVTGFAGTYGAKK